VADTFRQEIKTIECGSCNGSPAMDCLYCIIKVKIDAICAAAVESFALHEQEQRPLVEALKECIETESYWHGITCASGRDPSKECDCWVNRAKQTLAKIDATLKEVGK